MWHYCGGDVWVEWILIVIAAMAVVVMVVVMRLRDASSRDTSAPEFGYHYASTPLLVNASERAAWGLLRELPLGAYAVCPKVRIEDFITASGAERNRLRGYIKSRHVDFLLVDADWKPLLVIEVDGSSHHRQERKARDELIDRVLKSAGIPIVRLRVGENWRDRLMEWVNSNNQRVSADAGSAPRARMV